MSLKRVLGTMLASRMAGRGRRRGALGTAAMLGGLRRRRRPALGGKLGLAALGYMAYKAYQSNQSQSQGQGRTQTQGSTTGKSTGSSGGIGDMVQDVVNQVTAALGGSQSGGQSGGQQTTQSAAPAETDMQQEAQAAERMDESEALLLIRAMITAAYADGALDQSERQRIMSEINDANADQKDREIMEREIANPKPVDDLLTEVNDEETAEEFYMASLAAIDHETPANKKYLEDLRQKLGLSAEQAAEVEDLATA